MGGKQAGSGKSTLMKFISDHPRTEEALKQWSGTLKLHKSSHYFWNQGFELEISLRGLLRALLFQILNSTPSIVPTVYPKLPGENPSVKELKKALQEAVSLSKTSVKFCFFIDGLDEYHGDEEDLISILSFFSETLGVKLCVSSRPRSLFDKAFAVRRSTLVISEFALDDMRTFARSRFDESRYFRGLRTAEPVDCDDLMNRIAENSQGVWLWVFLVTRNLVRAINCNEGTAMLHRILDHFPQELEDYFKFMIQGVQKPYRHEMAQICLIVVEQIYPLPLYAFSLLGREEGKGGGMCHYRSHQAGRLNTTSGD